MAKTNVQKSTVFDTVKENLPDYVKRAMNEADDFGVVIYTLCSEIDKLTRRVKSLESEMSDIRKGWTGGHR